MMPRPFFLLVLIITKLIWFNQGLDIYQAFFSSSEGYSSPETTPCPSHILNAVNTQKEFLPIRPSGPLAELMFQIMDHYGFTSHGELSRVPSFQESLLAQGEGNQKAPLKQ